MFYLLLFLNIYLYLLLLKQILINILFLKNIDDLMPPEGVGLTTALRVLCNVACPPPPVEGNVATIL